MMRQLIRFLGIVMIGALFTSCSKWTKVNTVDGKTKWIRKEKLANSDSSRFQSIFSYEYKEQSFSRFGGNIFSDTTHGVTFFQFDSARIYLLDQSGVYNSIFSSGLISSQTIYCSLDTLCRPTSEGIHINSLTRDTIIPDLWGWTGNTIVIHDIQYLSYVKRDPSRRSFKLSFIPYKTITGGILIYLFELTNPSANTSTDLQTFIKGAKLTFLKYCWTEI
jgi:hypothetical protein